jgi:hypothetical protein
LGAIKPEDLCLGFRPGIDAKGHRDARTFDVKAPVEKLETQTKGL